MAYEQGFICGEGMDERLEDVHEIFTELGADLLNEEDDLATNSQPLSQWLESKKDGVTGGNIVTPDGATLGKRSPVESNINTPIKKKGKKLFISRSPVDARHFILDNDSKKLLEEEFARECIIRRYETRNIGNAEMQSNFLRLEIAKVNEVRLQKKKDFNDLIQKHGWEPQRAFADSAMQKIWDIARGPAFVNKSTLVEPEFKLLKGASASRFAAISKTAATLASRKK